MSATATSSAPSSRPRPRRHETILFAGCNLGDAAEWVAIHRITLLIIRPLPIFWKVLLDSQHDSPARRRGFLYASSGRPSCPAISSFLVPAWSACQWPGIWRVAARSEEHT